MFDLILTFGMASMSSQVGEERINADLKRALESEEPEVQAVAVEGIAKLMLTKVLRDAEVRSKQHCFLENVLPRLSAFVIGINEVLLYICRSCGR